MQTLEATQMAHTAQFKIGDRVKVHAYTDCFGEFHPETEPLIVSAVRLVVPTCDTLAPYYRIKADTTGKGYGYHEASERFFIAA
jgi:hypothetical protein